MSRTKINGFTMIEMIITISIVSVVAVVTAGFLFSSISGSGKAEIGKEARQNGNYALNVMQRMILNSKSVACPTPIPPATVGKQINVLDIDNNLTSFICNDSEDYTLSSVSATPNGDVIYNLTGDNVAVSICDFSCDIMAGKPSKVTIKFSVSQKGVSSRPSESGNIDFETDVMTKNY